MTDLPRREPAARTQPPGPADRPLDRWTDWLTLNEILPLLLAPFSHQPATPEGRAG
ncbi:hypothetical protein [Streptomyces sp. NPDC007205]|uniref:hypothetical protein n=1 Tax=Streptomyces sp. NPDC007205 TaxID=3154316 RepID=UPI00340AB663